MISKTDLSLEAGRSAGTKTAPKRRILSRLAKPFVGPWVALQVWRTKAKPEAPKLPAPLSEGPRVAGQPTSGGPYSRPVDNFRVVNVDPRPSEWDSRDLFPFYPDTFAVSMLAPGSTPGRPMIRPSELNLLNVPDLDYLRDIKVTVLPPDPDHHPVAMSAPNDKYHLKSVDAKFSSCASSDGLLTLNFEGKDPVEILVPKDGSFTIKADSGDPKVDSKDPGPKTAVTSDLAKAISEFCEGKTILGIGVVQKGIWGWTELCIVSTECVALTVTSDKPIVLLKPDF